MRLTIEVVGDDFLNKEFMSNDDCPMCSAAKRYLCDYDYLRMGGTYLRINRMSFPFLEINGETWKLGDSMKAVKNKKPFTFTVDVPEVYVKDTYKNETEMVTK